MTVLQKTQVSFLHVFLVQICTRHPIIYIYLYVYIVYIYCIYICPLSLGILGIFLVWAQMHFQEGPLGCRRLVSLQIYLLKGWI